MIKKTVLAVAILMVATNVWAVKSWNITNTKHNLSSGSAFGDGTYKSDPLAANAEDEVCIFCHTPHGGSLDAPLWNRNMPTNNFTHYTSNTISTTLGAANRPVNNESLACMSCHDGGVAVNSILNFSNRTGDVPNNSSTIIAFAFSGVVGAKIGASPADFTATRDLSDDHPISFSYNEVYNDAVEDYKVQLKAPDLARGAGVRFFPLNVADDGSIANGNRVECSSCHDPHVDYNADTSFTPFLVTSNAGSALCLACHIK